MDAAAAIGADVGPGVLAAAVALRWSRPDLTRLLAEHLAECAEATGDRDGWLTAAGWSVHAAHAVGDGRDAAAEVLDQLAGWGEAVLDGPAADRLRVELAVVAHDAGDTASAAALLVRPVSSDDVELVADRAVALARCAATDAASDGSLGAVEAAEAAWDRVPGARGRTGLASARLVAAAAERRRGRATEAVVRAVSGLSGLDRARGAGGGPTPSGHLAAALAAEWITALVDGGRIAQARDVLGPLQARLEERTRPTRQLAHLRLTIARVLATRPGEAAVEELQRAARDAAAADVPDLEHLCRTALGELHESRGRMEAAIESVRLAVLADRRHRARAERLHRALAAAGPLLGAGHDPEPTREAPDDDAIARTVVLRAVRPRSEPGPGADPWSTGAWGTDAVARPNGSGRGAGTAGSPSVSDPRGRSGARPSATGAAGRAAGAEGGGRRRRTDAPADPDRAPDHYAVDDRAGRPTLPEDGSAVPRGGDRTPSDAEQGSTGATNGHARRGQPSGASSDRPAGRHTDRPGDRNGSGVRNGSGDRNGSGVRDAGTSRAAGGGQHAADSSERSVDDPATAPRAHDARGGSAERRGGAGSGDGAGAGSGGRFRADASGRPAPPSSAARPWSAEGVWGAAATGAESASGSGAATGDAGPDSVAEDVLLPGGVDPEAWLTAALAELDRIWHEPAAPDDSARGCVVVLDLARSGDAVSGPEAADTMREVAVRLADRLPAGSRLREDAPGALSVVMPGSDRAAASEWMRSVVPAVADGLAATGSPADALLRASVHGTDGVVGAQVLQRLDRASDGPSGPPPPRPGATWRGQDAPRGRDAGSDGADALFGALPPGARGDGERGALHRSSPEFRRHGTAPGSGSGRSGSAGSGSARPGATGTDAPDRATTGSGTTGTATAGSGTTGTATAGSETTGPATTGPARTGPARTGTARTGTATTGPGTTGPGTTASGMTRSGMTGPATVGSATVGSGTVGSGTTQPGASGFGAAGTGTTEEGMTGPGTTGTSGPGTSGPGTSGTGSSTTRSSTARRDTGAASARSAAEESAAPGVTPTDPAAAGPSATAPPAAGPEESRASRPAVAGATAPPRTATSRTSAGADAGRAVGAGPSAARPGSAAVGPATAERGRPSHRSGDESDDAPPHLLTGSSGPGVGDVDGAEEHGQVRDVPRAAASRGPSDDGPDLGTAPGTRAPAARHPADPPLPSSTGGTALGEHAGGSAAATGTSRDEASGPVAADGRSAVPDVPAAPPPPFAVWRTGPVVRRPYLPDGVVVRPGTGGRRHRPAAAPDAASAATPGAAPDAADAADDRGAARQDDAVVRDRPEGDHDGGSSGRGGAERVVERSDRPAGRGDGQGRPSVGPGTGPGGRTGPGRGGAAAGAAGTGAVPRHAGGDGSTVAETQAETQIGTGRPGAGSVVAHGRSGGTTGAADETGWPGPASVADRVAGTADAGERAGQAGRAPSSGPSGELSGRPSGAAGVAGGAPVTASGPGGDVATGARPEGAGGAGSGKPADREPADREPADREPADREPADREPADGRGRNSGERADERGEEPPDGLGLADLLAGALAAYRRI